MSKISLFVFLLISSMLSAQKLSSYTATNGVTYKKGDAIELNRGSGLNGDFVYLRIGGWAAGSANVGSAYAGLAVNIKK